MFFVKNNLTSFSCEFIYFLLVSQTKRIFFVSLCFYSLTDDQGFADVSYTNPNLPFQTENIDKLAARSIRSVVVVHTLYKLKNILNITSCMINYNCKITILN